MRTISKSRITTLAALSLGATLLTAPASAPSALLPEQVEGRGWGTAVVCAGCIAGGLVIIGSGGGAFLAAAYAPGSGVAALACVAACIDAVS